MKRAFKINKTVAIDTNVILKQKGEEFAEVSTDNREIVEQFNLFYCTLFVVVFYVI